MSGNKRECCKCSNKIKPAAKEDNPRATCGSKNCPDNVGDSSEKDDAPSPPRKGCGRATCPKRAKPKDPDDPDEGKENPKPKGCDLASCLKRNQPDVRDEKAQPDTTQPDVPKQEEFKEESDVPEEPKVDDQPADVTEEEIKVEVKVEVVDAEPPSDVPVEVDIPVESDAPIDANAPTQSEAPSTDVPEAAKDVKGCKKSTCPKKKKPPPKPKTSRCSCKSKSIDNLKPRTSSVTNSTSNPQVKKPAEDGELSDTDSFCSCKSKSPDRKRHRSKSSADEDSYCSCKPDPTPCVNVRCPAKKVTYCVNDDDYESPPPTVKPCQNARCQSRKNRSTKNAYCGDDEKSHEDKCCSCTKVIKSENDSGDVKDVGDEDKCCPCTTRQASTTPVKKACENMRCPSKKVSYCGDDDDDDNEIDDDVKCGCGRSNEGDVNDRATMSTPEVRSCGSSAKRVVICTDDERRVKTDACECGGGRSSTLCLDMATSTPKVVTCEDGTYPKMVSSSGDADEICNVCGCTLRAKAETSTMKKEIVDSACETSSPKLPEKCCKCEDREKVGACPISITIYCAGESQSQLKSCPQAKPAESSSDSDGGQSPVDTRRRKKKRFKSATSDNVKDARTTNIGAQCCCSFVGPKGGAQRGCSPIFVEPSGPKLAFTKYFGGVPKEATTQMKHTCCTCQSRSDPNKATPRADQSTSYLQLNTCENSTCAGKNSVFCDGDTPEERKTPVPNDDIETCVSQVFLVNTATSTPKVNAVVRNALLKTDAGTCMSQIRPHEENEPIAGLIDKAAGSSMLLSHIHHAAYNSQYAAVTMTKSPMLRKVSVVRSHRVQCSDEKIASRDVLSSMHQDVQKNATLDASTEIASNSLRHRARSKSRKIQCSRLSVDAGDFDPGKICSTKSVRFNTVGVQKTPMADFASTFVAPTGGTAIVPTKWRPEATYYYTTMDFTSECVSGDFEVMSKDEASECSKSVSIDKATNVTYMKSRRSRRKRRERLGDDNDEELDVVPPVTPTLGSRNRNNAKKIKSSSVQVRSAAVKGAATGKSPSEVLIKCVDLENARPVTPILGKGGPFKPNSPTRGAERQNSLVRQATPPNETFVLCGDLEKDFVESPPTPTMAYRCPKHSKMDSKTNNLVRPISAPRAQSPGDEQFVSCGDLDKQPPIDDDKGRFLAYRCPKHGLIVDSATATNKTIVTHMPINVPKVKSRKIQSRSGERKNQ